MLESPHGTSSQALETKSPTLTAEQRGDILMARKMYREAIEVFAEGNMKDPVLRNKTGIAYHQLLLLDKAQKCYEQAIKLRPNYHEAVNNLGTIYYAKKSYRRAISQYRRALKIAPDQASVHSNLGTAYFARNQLDLALQAFRKALELDPDVFEHHSSYGVMLQERSVADRAKFHYSMATLYANQGRNDLAIQYLRKALEEGFKERKKLTEEPAFAALRELPEFKQLLTLEPRVL
ncbi:MAG TPA: tetratricopeptide repeat protein [Candidatus Acidoferrum sp.]|nr:tetratricopeptide repeat protein [Candidatus Acidoferrum sp.]